MSYRSFKASVKKLARKISYVWGSGRIDKFSSPKITLVKKHYDNEFFFTSRKPQLPGCIITFHKTRFRILEHIDAKIVRTSTGARRKLYIHLAKMI